MKNIYFSIAKFLCYTIRKYLNFCQEVSSNEILARLFNSRNFGRHHLGFDPIWRPVFHACRHGLPLFDKNRTILPGGLDRRCPLLPVADGCGAAGGCRPHVLPLPHGKLCPAGGVWRPEIHGSERPDDAR